MSLNGGSVIVRRLKFEIRNLSKKIAYHSLKEKEHADLTRMYQNSLAPIQRQLEFQEMIKK